MKFCIHKSDKDYGVKWATGDKLSHCVKCGCTLNHSEWFWPIKVKG